MFYIYNLDIGNMQRKQLVIIGGGFGGLNLAKHVSEKEWDVIIVDKHNYHSFPPLFYQVASSGLEPASISFPFRRELHNRKYRNATFHMGTVKEVDALAHEVYTEFETIHYDALVIAAGTTNNFFGIPDLEKHVFTIKSTPEAIRTRNEVLDRLEQASLCKDEALRRRLLTFVVVGGGPAGVEIAGALGEMKRYIVPREYRSIDPSEVKVIIVEGTDALLRAMSVKSQNDARKGLEQLMVEVQLNKTMKKYEDGTVYFADGSTIETETLIWTAGVTGVPFEIMGANVTLERGARLPVDQFNHVVGVPDIYAIGDIAMMETEKYPHGHPQVAQVALQMGKNLARNLSRENPRPFTYRDKGSMATIGRNRAVVDIGKFHLSGYIAWLAWIVVHLISLLGMRNRAVVLINWTWSYFTFATGLRLLMRPDRYPLRSYWNEKPRPSSR